MLNKNFFSSIDASSIKKMRLNKKGFSLIGVLVASVVGLIIVTGLSQMLVNMASQLKQIENRSKRESFTNLIRRDLNNQKACKNTLKDHVYSLWNGGNSQIGFGKIKNSEDEVVFDLDDPISNAFIKSNYGLDGAFFFELKCKTPPCTSSCVTPCVNSWTLSLISQSFLRGITLFNKPENLFEIDITFLY